ncbi:MAG: ATP-binding cassette domain-containing protein [Actinomycetota bacterium]
MSETVAESVDFSNAPASVVIDQAEIRYKVFQDQRFSARLLMSRGFKFRESVEVEAVKRVSLDVRMGEALGIVGSNGSGKSSLLRAIAGLQSLSSGRIDVRGRTGLLGVGAALKPGLSGHRNVILGGLAMGLTRDEVEDEMPRVVEFAGIGDAMKRPMNTYSSGMRARLAFSIATLRVPDVLLIDEALAVGDKEFRAKSLARIEEIRSAAGTVIMVTHSLNEILQSCTRAVWLEKGELRMTGSPDDVVAAYEGAD